MAETEVPGVTHAIYYEWRTEGAETSTLPLTTDSASNPWFPRVSRQEWAVVYFRRKTVQAPKLARDLPSPLRSDREEYFLFADSDSTLSKVITRMIAHAREFSKICIWQREGRFIPKGACHCLSAGQAGKRVKCWSLSTEESNTSGWFRGKFRKEPCVSTIERDSS